MSDVRTVTHLLRLSDRRFVRTQRRYFWLKFWFYLILIPLYCALFGLAIWLLNRTWHGGDWLTYSITLLSLGTFGIPLARVAILRDSRAHLFAPVAALRQAARTGDAKLAPGAVEPSDATSASALSSESARIGPLRRPASAFAIVCVALGALFLLVLFVYVPIGFAAGNPSVAEALIVALLPSGALLTLLGWRLLSPLYVRAGMDDLRWRGASGRLRRISWHAVHAFYRVSNSYDRETLYVLDAGASVFAWRASMTAIDAPQTLASAHLCTVITARTGLPLRDLTVEATRIAELAPSDPPLAGGAPEPAPIPGIIPRREVRRRGRIAAIALSPFLALALVSLSLMIYQPHYYEGLYSQAHAHRPLYSDTLAADDGDWPVSATMTFSEQAYKITDDDSESILYAAMPHSYDNALFEVTARTVGSDNLSGPGFAIKGQHFADPLLVFYVSPDGTWWLKRTSSLFRYEGYKFIELGDSSAIHSGFGADNRIAVLVQGNSFTFYVNGTYITGYQDDALSGGQVGLYADPSYPDPNSHYFRDFAIYPLG
ncbi:MAG: hypothetical protein OJF49_002829 [Ktedonobacterales bacterium]|jgi:hypothetical protein|nr:MAG: hypothetical protein OJF49_002829 [Ktedonobacterales bacterium]